MKEDAPAGAVAVEAEVEAGETDPVVAMAEEMAERDTREREASGALAVQAQEVEREGTMGAEPGAGARAIAARARSLKVMKRKN